MGVTRYTVGRAGLVRYPEGECVLYSDYAAVKAERDEARARCEAK